MPILLSGQLLIIKDFQQFAPQSRILLRINKTWLITRSNNNTQLVEKSNKLEKTKITRNINKTKKQYRNHYNN